MRLTRSYRAFLLRLWQESPGNQWRITMEDPHTAERRTFRDIEALFHFILAVTGARKAVMLIDLLEKGSTDEDACNED